MKTHIKIVLLFCLGWISFNVSAQKGVHFKTIAPQVVNTETPFQLVYQINASAKDLKAPDFKYFEILAGPFESRSSYHQYVNGKTSSSVSLSYTFTLLPTKAGTFRIPGASITVEGEKYHSNEVTIKVEEGKRKDENEEERGFSSNGNTQRVTAESIFIKTSVSKRNVYEQEAILVSYKLYTLLDVAQFTNVNLPDFNGFLKQEFEQSNNKNLSIEKHKGRNYGTTVLYETILFPQRTGELIIPEAQFTAILRLQNKAQIKSIFDDFFDSYTNVEKTLVAPGAKITVKELPTANKPASFSGAVGAFNIKASLDTKNIKSNEATTLTVEIAGVGNMKLLKNPEIKFPKEFEVYDPKVDNKFNTSSDGLRGIKKIEYMFIPRKSGKYEIPSAELSYFDLDDHTYKTLKTPLYTINVAKGKGEETVVVGGNYKEEVEKIAKDIRYIYTDRIELQSEKRPIFGTTLFWILFIIPFVIACILFLFLRKYYKANSDIALVKTRKANKVAKKRLKLAQQYLSQGKKDLFYREVMRATWSYLSDKLSIPISELNKENVVSVLTSKDIERSVVDELIDLLNSCDYAIYAPDSGQKEMGNLYERSIEIISKIDEQFKKQKR